MDSNDKLFGILSYIGILWLVPLLAGKTEFARFHANQGIVLTIADVILGAAAGVTTSVLNIVHLGWIGGICSGAVSIGCFVLMIIGIINAAQGNMKELPVIGSFRVIK